MRSVKKAKERHKKQSKTKGGGGNDDGDGGVGLQVGSVVEVCCGGSGKEEWLRGKDVSISNFCAIDTEDIPKIPHDMFHGVVDRTDRFSSVLRS